MPGLLPVDQSPTQQAHFATLLRRNLLAHLRTLPPWERGAELRRTAIVAGGTYVEPSGKSWQPTGYSFTVHGLSGFGDTANEAAQDWMKACDRTLEVAA